ncbi:hypothetical protein CHLRE_16g676200v5 [Chlamydomonas reinhardtii]|uniref:GB1/RHD3-type G domain-containing protein n=1 Tax=Chlamydomonas reinhardtii TaxID=3055 RepID=A0A2K3CVD7_CHLRE|nr:uncharacterized protein CHLRE_16g676200v5 [Chlamydomonas reinhardtii]PNW72241.1 hypothetical protein CHLRE_16g676200v5 [Chlamydomonas reinhardtii]
MATRGDGEGGARSDVPTPAAGGEPLQLIAHNEGTWTIGEKALEVLKRIKAPIAVVAVCGRARTGKSYILNKLLGAAGAAGFEVASSYRPCTKGLWMWSQPLRRTALDGSNYYLVLLDTEGIDAYNQTTQDGVSLFSLAVLLSSLFVFNQMGGIDEAALDRLALVTELTRRIRVHGSPVAGSGGGAAEAPAAAEVEKTEKKKGKGKGSEASPNGGAGTGAGGSGGGAAGSALLEEVSALSEFTPSFMWLLRDFYYDLEGEHGVKQSPRDYLETALMPTAGSGPAVEAKNMIRESIKSLFKERECVTLVRPVSDEEALRNLDKLPEEELRPEFVEGVSKLTAAIFARAQPKRLGTQLLSGPLLAGLAQAYVKAINTGAVPTIHTAWHSVAEGECRAACYAAEDAYRAAFDPNTPADEQLLEKEHQRALAAATTAFQERAVGDPGLQRRWQQRFVAACSLAFEAVRERRLAVAAEALERQLGELAGQLHTEARLGGQDFSRLAASVEAGVAGVVAATVGAARWPRLLAFTHQQYGGLGAEMWERAAAKAEAERQRAALEARAQVAEAQRQVAMLQADLADAKRRADEATAAAAAATAAAAAAKANGSAVRTNGGGGGAGRRAAAYVDSDDEHDPKSRGCFGFGC